LETQPAPGWIKWFAASGKMAFYSKIATGDLSDAKGGLTANERE
jgi:hypothetical protein